jgi:hypothetical protein
MPKILKLSKAEMKSTSPRPNRDIGSKRSYSTPVSDESRPSALPRWGRFRWRSGPSWIESPLEWDGPAVLLPRQRIPKRIKTNPDFRAASTGKAQSRVLL